MTKQQPEIENTQDVVQLLQQKIGNLELTVHAMMQVLEEQDMLNQKEVNEQAQEIVADMQQEIEKEELEINTSQDEE